MEYSEELTPTGPSNAASGTFVLNLELGLTWSQVGFEAFVNNAVLAC
jgi:hypothetical protein